MAEVTPISQVFRRVEVFALRHRWTIWTLAALLPATLIAWGVYDREPPIVIEGPPTSIPMAHAGEEITFDLPVDRDTSRDCSLVLHRAIVDSSGALRPFGAAQEISAEGIKHREWLTPDRLRIRFTLPESLPSGPAHLLTEAAYACPRNLTTLVYPIRRSWDWPFLVLPPPSK